jgi:hypothetical protein
MSEAHEIAPAQKRWAFAAAALFLTALGLLGFALNTGIMRSFAIGWVLLQVFGYAGSLKMSNGDLAHPLFQTQVVLHGLVLFLLVALIFGAGK